MADNFFAPSVQDATASLSPLSSANMFAGATALSSLMAQQQQINNALQQAKQSAGLYPGQLAQQNAQLGQTQEGTKVAEAALTTPAAANAQLKAEVQVALGSKTVPDNISEAIDSAFDPEDNTKQITNAAVQDFAAALRGMVATNKAAVGQTNTDEKAWQKLGAAMDIFIKGRGNQIMNTINRAKQGLAILDNYEANPTPQVLSALESDVASIMTGGVATGTATADASYHTIFSDLDNKLAYWTGSLSMGQKMYKQATGGVTPLANILAQIRGQLNDLLNVSSDTLEKQLLSEAGAYQPIINSDPARFQKMVNDKLNVSSVAGAPKVGSNVPAASSGNSSVDDLFNGLPGQ